jgi:hypothetical protein
VHKCGRPVIKAEYTLDNAGHRLRDENWANTPSIAFTISLIEAQIDAEGFAHLMQGSSNPNNTPRDIDLDDLKALRDSKTRDAIDISAWAAP